MSSETEEYFNKLIKKYETKQGVNHSRIDQFRDLSPLTRDLMITLYSTFDKYLEGPIHPIEEYLISFDENMFEDGLIVSIARRMGIYIETDENAYEVFVDRVVEVIQTSGFTYDEYYKYINMTKREFENINTDYNFDDRLFAFIKFKNKTR